MRSNAKRYFLIIAGWLSVALGVIGIVLPLLPTTPFILLAGGCFAKSSPRFHRWLLEHAFFGPLIKSYQGNQGIPRKVKIRAIVFIWITLSISILLLSITWLRVAIFILGLILSVSLWRAAEPDDNTTTS